MRLQDYRASSSYWLSWSSVKSKGPILDSVTLASSGKFEKWPEKSYEIYQKAKEMGLWGNLKELKLFIS